MTSAAAQVTQVPLLAERTLSHRLHVGFTQTLADSDGGVKTRESTPDLPAKIHVHRIDNWG